ncbi:MAG: 50S ribosomal protein L23 [Actinomycetota bacterium]|jgi:large subunit ribosomal protein L23
MNPRDVVIRPVISEKSYALIDENAYTFIVHPDATKPEIRDAVQAIWGVRVISVNTVQRRGKMKRYRFTRGRTKGSKRAVVKLALGDKIELFETR